MEKLEPNIQPKNKSKNLLKTILIIAGFVLAIGLLIVEGILGWNLIKGVKDEQGNIKSSQEENNNKYSSLQKSLEENNTNLEKLENRITKLEKKQNTSGEKEEASESETSESEEESSEDTTETSTNCDFSKEVNLRTTDSYDIFGGSEFDTVVCGYVKIQKEIVWEEEQENAYFVITKYKDEKLRESIVEGIKSGNTVNKKIGDYYGLNLGCKEGDTISGMQYTDDTYLNDETQSKILSSTQDNPLSLIVSFDKHEGVGCSCCNLASKIRLY